MTAKEGTHQFSHLGPDHLRANRPHNLPLRQTQPSFEDLSLKIFFAWKIMGKKKISKNLGLFGRNTISGWQSIPCLRQLEMISMMQFYSQIIAIIHTFHQADILSFIRINLYCDETLIMV